MKKCLIYIRVSTTEQAQEGRSLEDQKRICKRFAKEKGLKVEQIFEDAGKSATTMNRPGLRDLLERVNEKDIEAVLVLDTDRIARNIQDHLAIKTILKKNGAKLISVNQPGFDDSVEGVAMDSIMAVFNTYQSQICGRKIAKTMDEKVNDGWYPKPAPLGYRNIENPNKNDRINRHIIGVDTERTSYISRAFRLFSTGMYSCEALNDLLYEEGLRTRAGKKLHLSKFNFLLQNPFYYGVIPWKGEHKQGKHQPLTNEDTFGRCQEVFRLHNQNANRRRKYDFLLRGVIFCNKCGLRYTFEHNHKKVISYAHCTNKLRKHSNKGQHIEIGELENLIADLFKTIQLPQSLIDKVVEKARLVLLETHEDIDQKRNVLTGKKLTLERRRSTLENKWLEGIVDDSAYKRLHGDVENEIDQIEDQISQLGKNRKKNINIFESLVKLTKGIYQVYISEGTEIKKQFLSLFWDRIEIADKQIQKAVPTKIILALAPKYPTLSPMKVLTSNLRSEHSLTGLVRTKSNWRAWRGSNPRRSP